MVDSIKELYLIRDKFIVCPHCKFERYRVMDIGTGIIKQCDACGYRYQKLFIGQDNEGKPIVDITRIKDPAGFALVKRINDEIFIGYAIDKNNYSEFIQYLKENFEDLDVCTLSTVENGNIIITDLYDILDDAN